MMKKRIISAIMGAVMIFTTALPQTWGETVMAAEETPSSMFANSDFSDGFQQWTNRLPNATIEQDADGVNVVSFKVENIGQVDWECSLAQDVGASNMEVGKYYRIEFDIKSTVARKILVMPDNQRKTSNMTGIKAGSWQHVKMGFDYEENMSSNILLCFAQKVDGMTQPMFTDAQAGHTIQIKNLSMYQTIPADQDVEGNIIKDGTFTGASDWKYSIVKGMSGGSIKNYAAFTGISGSSEASDIALVQKKVALQRGDYDLKFYLTSTIDRDFVYSVGENVFRVSAKAGEETKVEISYHSDSAGEVPFKILLGRTYNGKDLFSGTAHDIRIRNVSMVRNDQQATTLLPEITKTTASKYNILENGNFYPDAAGWTSTATNSTIYRPNGKDEQYRYTFQITGDTINDYDVRLQQAENNKLSANTTYRIQADIFSTVDRDVTLGFEYVANRIGTKSVKANETTTVSFEYTPTAAINNPFAIYLGGAYGEHVVSVSNVSVIESSSLGTNDVNDPLPKAIDNLTDVSDPEQATILKNGDFGYNLEYWDRYQLDWMWQYDTVKYTKPENGNGIKVSYGATGTSPDDIKIWQQVKMSKNLQYVVSFDVYSQKGRNFQIRMDGLRENFVKTIAVQSKHTRHVSFNLPVQKKDKLATFNLLMGYCENTPSDDYLEFSNMKIEVYNYENLALLIQEGKMSDCDTVHYEADGDFTDGVGRFVVENATADTSGRFLKLTPYTNMMKQVTLTRNSLKFFKGKTYDISFYACADPYRTANLYIRNGSNDLFHQKFELKYSSERYVYTFTPDKDYESASLVFDFGFSQGPVYLDTVRIDLQGYLDAKKSVVSTNYDIRKEDDATPPVISEQSLNYCEKGKAVTLTYEYNSKSQSFISQIKSVSVVRKKAKQSGSGILFKDAGKTVEAIYLCDFRVPGQIVIPASVFDDLMDTGADAPNEQLFEIVLTAPLYEKVVIHQKRYLKQQWNLAWQDEFGGTQISLGRWSVQEGTGAEYGLDGWGNNEQQLYTSPFADAKYPGDNITVSDGALTIAAQAATNEERDLTGKKYTSGRIWTMNDDGTAPLFAQQYGKIEAKIKMPAGLGYEGIWPAFWMLPVDKTYGGWPLSGEIDIMEARGRQPNKVDGTIHFGQPWPNNVSDGGSIIWENDEDAITDFHVYDIEWEPGEIRWYCDGALFYTAKNWYSQASGSPSPFTYPAPYDQRFYIILNMAVGGTFDVNRVPSDDVLDNAKMVVDYVRTYTAVDSSTYETNPDKPKLTKDKLPSKAKKADKNKDYITDGEFKKVVIKTDNGTAASKDGWTFATLPEFSGSATLKTENGSAKIDIKNAGNAVHSVQLMQNVPIVYGRYYEISFDAKSTSTRTLTVKAGDDGTGDDNGDNVWTSYGIVDTTITDKMEHYSSVFQMTKPTNSTCRLEFNMGGSTAGLTLENIHFKEVKDSSGDENGRKRVLNDGNVIYNGSFNVGGIQHMTYWNLKGANKDVQKRVSILPVLSTKEYLPISVISGHDQAAGYAVCMKPEKQEKLQIYQVGNQFQKDKNYTVSFDAYSEAAAKIVVKIMNKAGKVLYTSVAQSMEHGDTYRTYSHTIQMKKTDRDARVVVQVEGGTTYITNLSVMGEKVLRDFEDISVYPIANGSFENEKTGWTTYGEVEMMIESDADQKNHKKVMAASVTKKGYNWEKMLIYDGIQLASGVTYKFEFDAKSDVVNPLVSVAMEDTNYTRHFEQSNVMIKKSWRHYSYTFTSNSDNKVALKFLLGANVEDYTFYLDNVMLGVDGANRYAANITPQYKYGYVGEDVVLDYLGDEEWAKKKSLMLMVDGKMISSNKVQWTDETITIDKSVFPEASIYKIYISDANEEFADTNIVDYKIIDLEANNAVANTSFQSGLNGWMFWAMDQCASWSSNKGSIDIHIKKKVSEETWAVQLKQENNSVEPGHEYELSFTGAATMPRSIMIEGANYATVDLTENPEKKTVRFTPESYDIAINFLMGNVNNTPDREHHIYISDIVLREVDVAGRSSKQKGNTKDPVRLHTPDSVVVPNTSKNVIIMKINQASDAPSGVKYQIKIPGVVSRTISNVSKTLKIPVKKSGTYEYTVKVLAPGRGYKDSKVISGKVRVSMDRRLSSPTDLKAETSRGSISLSFRHSGEKNCKYVIYLNGKEIATTTKKTYKLNQIPTGIHKLAVAAVGTNQRMSKKSKTLYVYVNKGNGIFDFA
ncbi:MAG: carbohydrate binding domain-containing protein [Lachnospiraceae bacterium]